MKIVDPNERLTNVFIVILIEIRSACEDIAFKTWFLVAHREYLDYILIFKDVDSLL